MTAAGAAPPGTRAPADLPASREPDAGDDAPVGARVADRVTEFMGSWRFIVIQTVLVVIWLTANVILLTRPFDPYPFILLNLAFSPRRHRQPRSSCWPATDPSGATG